MAVAVLAPGAQASDSVLVTFEVLDGGISLAIANKGSSFPVTGLVTKTAAGALGDVTVTDARGSLAGWNVTASMAGPFQAVDGLGGAVDLNGVNGTADDVIPCTAATVTAAAVTATSGSIGVVGPAAGSALPLGDAGGGACSSIIATATTTGSNSATFPTSVSVAIPTSALAGRYQGTIVQTAG